MKVLIGGSGLVGTTLQETIQFDHVFNSKNIDTFDQYNFNNAVLYLSCLPATKWQVNMNIAKDVDNMFSIINTIKKFYYSKIVLISTIDVYCDSPLLSNEDYAVNVKSLNYGTNRYLFEKLVKQYLDFIQLQIFRIPALYNKHIKKNILYDLLNNNNIDQININSAFQWYNLDRLATDIQLYSEQYPNRSVFNLFTEPLETSEIVNLFPEAKQIVDYHKPRVQYNYTTNLSKSGYILNNQQVLQDVKEFISK